MAKTKNRRKKPSHRRRKASSLTHFARIYRRLPAPDDMDTSAAWFLICTNPTKERRAQLGLEFRGYKVFLPQVTFQGMRRNKIVDLTRPLFPGYLLVNLAGQPWYPIRRVDGVHSIVTNNLRPVPLPKKAVEEIVRLSREEQEIAPTEAMPAFEKGEQARVIGGPFASFLSTVVEVLPNGRAQVLVDIFGRATELELDLVQLEAISA